MARYGFEACNIHYEGHWKGWALEIHTFLGPEMATSEQIFDNFQLNAGHTVLHGEKSKQMTINTQ